MRPLPELIAKMVEQIGYDHLCNGKCPDDDMPDVRDPDCFACECEDVPARLRALVNSLADELAGS